MSAFDVIYNGETYEQRISILRTKPKAVDENKITYQQILDNQLINKLQIVSDIRSIYLTGTLSYTDTGRFLMPKIVPDGYTFVNIQIDKQTNFASEYSFDHTFIVTDMKVADKATDLFKLTLVSLDWYTFDNHLVYSTNGKELSTTVIMSQMMKRSGLKVSAPKVNSTQKLKYLTPTSFSLMDSFNDVLSCARDTQNSMYFAAYSHEKNEYQIRSFKELMLNPDNIDVNNELVLPGAETGNVPGQRTFNGAVIQSYTSFDYMINGTKETIIRTYDYKTRAFESKFLNRKAINSFFPPAPIKGYETRFKNVPYSIKSDVRNATLDKLCTNFKNEDQFREIFYLTESIEGNTYGVLRRQAGELFFLSVDRSDKYYFRMTGAWLITRVFHTFTRNVYENSIQACRTDTANELDNLVVSTSETNFAQETSVRG